MESSCAQARPKGWRSQQAAPVARPGPGCPQAGTGDCSSKLPAAGPRLSAWHPPEPACSCQPSCPAPGCRRQRSWCCRGRGRARTRPASRRSGWSARTRARPPPFWLALKNAQLAGAWASAAAFVVRGRADSVWAGCARRRAPGPRLGGHYFADLPCPPSLHLSGSCFGATERPCQLAWPPSAVPLRVDDRLSEPPPTTGLHGLDQWRSTRSSRTSGSA